MKRDDYAFLASPSAIRVTAHWIAPAVNSGSFYMMVNAYLHVNLAFTRRKSIPVHHVIPLARRVEDLIKIIALLALIPSRNSTERAFRTARPVTGAMDRLCTSSASLAHLAVQLVR